LTKVHLALVVEQKGLSLHKIVDVGTLHLLAVFEPDFSNKFGRP
jgi:hypothetical protein